MRKTLHKHFDWTGIELPVQLKDIDKFEKQNPYALNVYGCNEHGEINILRISNKQAHMINLLLISNDKTNHYCWIKNMSRLLSSQINNNKSTRVFCYRCLNSFNSNKSLEKHIEDCSKDEAVNVKMPPKDKNGNPPHICFNNYNRKMRVPFVVYADFECSTKKIDTKPPDDKSKSLFTQKYQEHKPSAFCYYIKCFDDILVFPPKLVQYTAQSEEDIAQMFLDSLEADIDKI